MEFGEVIVGLKNGLIASRLGWNGKNLWVHLQRPDEHSKMTRPYFYMESFSGGTAHYGDTHKPVERVPWVPSVTDILANDWTLMRP